MCCCLHFFGLKTKPEEIDQASSLSRSFYRRIASWVEPTLWYSLVLSANEATLEFTTTSWRWFTCKINNIGPEMEPWGTPDVTSISGEVVPSKYGRGRLMFDCCSVPLRTEILQPTGHRATWSCFCAYFPATQRLSTSSYKHKQRPPGTQTELLNFGKARQAYTVTACLKVS